MRTFSSRLTVDRIPARRAASVGTCPPTRPLAPVHPQVQALIEIFQGQEILPSFVRAALHYPWLRFIDANVEQRFLHYAQGRRKLAAGVFTLGWLLHALLAILPVGILSAIEGGSPVYAYLNLWPFLLAIAVALFLMAVAAKDTPFNVIMIEMLFGCLLRLNVFYAADEANLVLPLRMAFASTMLAVVLIIDCSDLRFITAMATSGLVLLQFVGFVIWLHLAAISTPLEPTLYFLYALVVTGVTLYARFREEKRLRLLFFIMNCYHPPLDDSAARGASQRKTMELLDILSRAIPALESIALLPAARDTQKMLERCWGLLSGTIDVPDEEWEYLQEEDREVLDSLTGERFFNEAMDTNLSRLSMRMRDDIAVSSPSSVLSSASVKTEAASALPRRERRNSTFTHGVGAPAIKTLATLATPLPSPTHLDIDLHNAPSRQQSPAPPRLGSEPRSECRPTSRFHVLDVHFPLFSHFKRLEATQRSDPPLTEITRPSSPVNSDWELPDLLSPVTDGTYVPILAVGFAYLAPFCKKGILHSDSNVLKRFLWCLQNLYLDNPYHNAFHAAQVMHSSCWLAKTILKESFEDFDQMSLAVAALAHDVGHPARTNGFLCATGSILSRVYNDQSVLENYHAALLFTVLASSRYDIFEQTSRKDFFAFRKFAIEAILSTDMADHFEFLNRAKLRFCAADFDVRTQEEDKSLFYSIVIKAGDLSHTAVSWDHHQRWSKRVGEEFYLQGDEEARRSLPISSLCDRSHTNARDFAKGQLSFLQFVAEPIYDQLDTLDSSGRVRDQCLTAMVRNKLKWQMEEDVAAD